MYDSEDRGAGDDEVRQQWPEGGLESVEECPVCGSGRRRALYVGLRDNVFFCAPGEWALHDCLDCGSAYLDPRPSAETLPLAYRTYYTHDAPKTTPAANLRGLGYIRRLLINGYKNWRFGATLEPSSALGVPLVLLLPFIRTATEHAYRHLPRTAQHGRLLDIGFGSGAFLDAARAIGWEVTGIDPDPQSVTNALERGLKVYQGDLAVLAGESNAFDVITLSHVIEHVHQPIPVLQACHRLLRPGGKLWLETPNINSLGRMRFQNNWRGLETPRHLVIFNGRSLHAALNHVGFTDVRDASRPNPCFFIYTSSQRMQQGLDPYATTPASIRLKAEIMATGFLESWWRSRREYISVTASKPKEPSA